MSLGSFCSSKKRHGGACHTHPDVTLRTPSTLHTLCAMRPQGRAPTGARVKCAAFGFLRAGAGGQASARSDRVAQDRRRLWRIACVRPAFVTAERQLSRGMFGVGGTQSCAAGVAATQVRGSIRWLANVRLAGHHQRGANLRPKTPGD
jgi:hypothetical protein